MKSHFRIRTTVLCALMLTSYGQLMAQDTAQNPADTLPQSDPATDTRRSDWAAGRELPGAWHLEEAVQAGLTDVNPILASSAYARFREYLLLETLQAELGKGKAADRTMVEKIRRRYAAQHDLLRRAEFEYMRQALDAWLQSLAATPLSQLATKARGAAEKFDMPLQQILQRRLGEVKGALPAFDTYLRQSPSRQQDWYDFLRMNQLTEQLDLGSPDPALMEQIYLRHLAGTFRIRTAASRNLAEALRQATRAAYAARSTHEEYRSRLVSLADALENCQSGCGSEDREKMAEALRWLGRRAMAPDLLRDVRRQLRQPNLLIQVSRQLAGIEVDQVMRDNFDVNDIIRDTRYVGQGNLTGQVALSFTPSFQQARGTVGLTAVLNSRTTGYNSAATIRSQSTTRVRGQKTVRIDQHGLASQPATADADTNSQVTGIDPLRRLGRRRVYQEVYAQQPDTDRDVEVRTASRLATELDRRLAEQIRPLDDFYQQRIRNPLLRRSRFPTEFATRTTRQHAYLSVTQTGNGGLARTGRPPAVEQPLDLACRVHESYFNNLATALLAGATIDEQELAEWLKPWFQQVPQGLQTTDPAQIWTVTFAKDKPVMVEIGEARLSVQVRGERFEVGNEQYPGMWITADYRLVHSDEGLKGLREPRLQIVPPNFDPQAGVRLGARHQVLRTMIRRRFQRVFPDEFTIRRIELGAQQKTQELILDQSYTTDGWLGLVFRIAQRPTAATARLPSP